MALSFIFAFYVRSTVYLIVRALSVREIVLSVPAASTDSSIMRLYISRASVALVIPVPVVFLLNFALDILFIWGSYSRRGLACLEIESHATSPIVKPEFLSGLLTVFNLFKCLGVSLDISSGKIE